MSENVVSLKIKISFPAILIAVLILHAILMVTKGLSTFTLADFLPKDKVSVLKIRRVKTHEVKHPQIRPMESVLNNGSAPSLSESPKKGPVSLKDLAIVKTDMPVQKTIRPGTRPEAFPTVPKAMNKISLKSKEFKEATGSKAFPSGGLSMSNMMAGAEKISDALVSIEVPDGIEPEELNEYELMFYGFQRRTAINYVNSILKNLDKFQKTHPRYRLPVSGKITMTARLTYDKEGNVMQIKMIRWTHVKELQDLFEDIAKNIDQLHNPPRQLWEKNNEFAMFYTLEIING